MTNTPKRFDPMCARCQVNRRANAMTGCLCVDCENAIDGMTQAELDADYEKHRAAVGAVGETGQ